MRKIFVVSTGDQEKPGYHFDSFINIQFICVWEVNSKY